MSLPIPVVYSKEAKFVVMTTDALDMLMATLSLLLVLCSLKENPFTIRGISAFRICSSINMRSSTY
jgi:hypothetical protein